MINEELYLVQEKARNHALFRSNYTAYAGL